MQSPEGMAVKLIIKLIHLLSAGTKLLALLKILLLSQLLLLAATSFYPYFSSLFVQTFALVTCAVHNTSRKLEQG